MKKYIDKIIELANKSLKNGDIPVGAIIIKDNANHFLLPIFPMWYKGYVIKNKNAELWNWAAKRTTSIKNNHRFFLMKSIDKRRIRMAIDCRSPENNKVKMGLPKKTIKLVWISELFLYNTYANGKMLQGAQIIRKTWESVVKNEISLLKSKYPGS